MLWAMARDAARHFDGRVRPGWPNRPAPRPRAQVAIAPGRSFASLGLSALPPPALSRGARGAGRERIYAWRLPKNDEEGDYETRGAAAVLTGCIVEGTGAAGVTTGCVGLGAGAVGEEVAGAVGVTVPVIFDFSFGPMV